MSNHLCSLSFALLLTISLTCQLETQPGNNFLEESVIIQVAQGSLEGNYNETLSGKLFTQFLGIPYANPPKRFHPPERVDNWTGIKDARSYGPRCSQVDYSGNIAGQEDCLVLNIYTPHLFNNESHPLLPVIVYIHGGSFQTGGNWIFYGPDYVMETSQVIFITFNYRLGALGFLSTGPQTYFEGEEGEGWVSGNNGLKDQAMALQFVKENIEYFGGDKERVLIVGESAGGAATSLHLLSPLSKGLFHAALSISGSSLCPWALSHNPSETFNKISQLTGCAETGTETVAEKLKCLSEVDYTEILKYQALQKWSFVPMAAFGPVVELNNSNGFLPDSPHILLSTGQISNSVPFISGVVKQESLLEQSGVILADATATQQLNSDWLKYAPIAFMFDETEMPEDFDEISNSIRSFYLEAGEPVSNLTRDKVEKMFSDRYFVYPVETQARLYAQSSGAPTYLYLFDFPGEYSLADPTPGNPNQTVTHVDDTQYFLRWKFNSDFILNSTFAFTGKYCGLWASFAADQKPTGTWDSAKVWPSLEQQNVVQNNLTWYEINDETNLIEEPFHYRLNFWRSLSLNFNN